MNTDPVTCPKCGGAIPADAPQGLCPRCVLAAAAMPTEAARTTGPRVAAPPLENVRAAFPQLEIIELIGQGGMGVVYKARQPKLDRFVALKILAESLAKDPTFEERFTREARMLAKLSHPNIVTIYDHGIASAPQTTEARPETQFYYLLMEFVDGVNLRQAMAAGRFTATEALALVPRICEALQYAHDEGVLHRDIKPENILLDGRGRVKIADFGIAKMLGEAQPGGTLTASGASLGTPHYMSPEQIEHPSEVDHRTDIFSLGVVFYEMLTGELPLGRFGPPSAKSAVDRRVDEIVFRTLEKERDLRQQSAGEVRAQVETVAAGMKSGSTPPRGAGFAEPVVPLRNGTAYISTPEHLRTFWGRQYLYTGKGTLTLDRERLTFVRDSPVTTIPLKSITGLTLGTYPRLMKPTGLNYIAVAYEKAGAKSLLLFTPHRSPWDATWTTNSVVADWHSALREATAHTQGREPQPVPADLLHVPQSFRHVTVPILAFLAIFAGGIVAFGLVAVLAKTGTRGIRGLSPLELVGVGVPITLLLVAIGALWLWARRGRGGHPDEVNSPGATRFGWAGRLFGGLVLILFLFASVFLVTFAVYQRSARPSPAMAPPPAPVAVEPALPLPTAVASAQAKPTDTIQEIELKVAKQQLEKTLTDLADADKELATSETLAELGDNHPARKAVRDRLQFLAERRAVLEKDIQAKAASNDEADTAIREIRARVTRDQFEKTLTSIDDAEKEFATSPALASLSDEHPRKKALRDKIQFLQERRSVLQKEIQELNAQAKPVATAATNGLPQMLPPGKTTAAAQKWHFAWVALTENKKQFEAGAIPQEGVLAAERDLAVAEGEFLGKPVIGATANVVYARSMLDITRRKQAAGMATPRDINEATLSVTRAEEALNRASASGTTPRR